MILLGQKVALLFGLQMIIHRKYMISDSYICKWVMKLISEYIELLCHSTKSWEGIFQHSSGNIFFSYHDFLMKCCILSRPSADDLNNMMVFSQNPWFLVLAFPRGVWSSSLRIMKLYTIVQNPENEFFNTHQEIYFSAITIF